ncbi:hypothetical protein IVB46_33290 [Bradyrhizobium sp. 61]|uniref:hypothetical protein n=1 Tax=Bradyrhizobium sp. 61 TaxID=2782679 RepID=UPI001FF92010|nr:hypothetical protein [Bradyrhizobium sp. 61]MCK1280109.1 hypothetical protein [Bradyrhizobium sp. 61]
MTEPVYLKGRPIKISIGVLMKLFKMLDELKLLDAFIAEADADGSYLTVDARTVNFIKRYVFEKNLHIEGSAVSELESVRPHHSELAQSIVGKSPPECGTYKCCHIHNGVVAERT